MSTDWGIRCVDCNEYGCEQENRGLEWVQNIIRCAPAIVALYDASTDRDMTVQHKDGAWAGYVDMAFIAKHRGHRLAPCDEYGRDFHQCLHDFTCEHCDTRHPCTLDAGHEGPHQKGTRP